MLEGDRAKLAVRGKQLDEELEQAKHLAKQEDSQVAEFC